MAFKIIAVLSVIAVASAEYVSPQQIALSKGYQYASTPIAYSPQLTKTVYSPAAVYNKAYSPILNNNLYPSQLNYGYAPAQLAKTIQYSAPIAKTLSYTQEPVVSQVYSSYPSQIQKTYYSTPAQYNNQFQYTPQNQKIISSYEPTPLLTQQYTSYQAPAVTKQIISTPVIAKQVYVAPQIQTTKSIAYASSAPGLVTYAQPQLNAYKTNEGIFSNYVTKSNQGLYQSAPSVQYISSAPLVAQNTYTPYVSGGLVVSGSLHGNNKW